MRRVPDDGHAGNDLHAPDVAPEAKGARGAAARSPKRLRWLAASLFGAVIWPVLFLICLAARSRRKPVDVGLGPHPLLNNVYHKKALTRFGYSAETFVFKTNFITGDFDIDLERRLGLKSLPVPLNRLIAVLAGFALAVWRYRLLYIYFNGGPLGILPGLLKYSEAFLFRLAGVRVVVMPYGSDIHDARRNPNLVYKHAMAQSYPGHRTAANRRAGANVDYWTTNADHIISGVEWVDYMPYWDTLTLGHFSIDCAALRPLPGDGPPYVPGARPLRLLHAPNHRHIKGTGAILAAVEDLKRSGHSIELVLVEKRPNHELLEEIARADVVVDQLVMGWYALFAIEAMALGKPVVCGVRDDLADLYYKAGLLDPGELPVLQADALSIRSLIEQIAAGDHDLAALGRKGRAFVERHHSLEAVGAIFDRINRSIGVAPSGAPPEAGPPP